MFRVTRYPIISKTESGWIGYRKEYRVAGRVRVPAGHCIVGVENVHLRLLYISGLHQEGQTKSPNVYTAAAECVQSNKYQTIADWKCPYRLSKVDASILGSIQSFSPPIPFTYTCLTATLKHVVMLLADQLSRDGFTRPGSCQEVELLHLEQLEASTGVEGGD